MDRRVGERRITLTAVTAMAAFLALVSSACAAPTSEEGTDDESVDSAEGAWSSGSFVARGTGYYPDSSALEGGFVDRKGKPLKTLQQFLAGDADYVSVAMDTKAFKYGQRLTIHELDEKYGASIIFRVVDTGGAFRGKGRTRIDICTQNERASLDPTINGKLNIDAIDESDTDGN